MAKRRSSMRRSEQRLVPLGAIAALLLVIGGVTVATLASRGGETVAGSDDQAVAVGQAATGPARATSSFFGRIIGMWDAAGQAQRLEAENRDLRAWRDMAQRLAERNQRFEALLRMPPDAFGEGADLTQALAAQVVLDSGGPFMRTLVANAGAEHGVRVGYIAVNENGLIGRVVSVGRRSSRILMLDDYNSRVPVMGASSRVRALVIGEASRPPEIYAQPTAPAGPRLDYMEQNLREGERIITSGDGGVFPRGLTVGYAHQVAPRVWRVTLAASQAPIDFVRITPYAGLETPEREGAVADPGPPVRRIATQAPQTPAPQPVVAAPPRPTQPPSLTVAPDPSDAPAPAPTPAAQPAPPQ